MNKFALLLATATCVAGISQAQALTVTQTTRDTLNTPFTPGTGNLSDDFAITRIVETNVNNNNIEIGIKGKQRFQGQAGVGGSGTLYTVQPGISTVSGTDLTPDPTRAWWNFDYSIDLGERNFENTDVVLTIIDPEADTYTLDFGPAIDFEFGSGTAATLSVIQNSWNIGFDFINTGGLGTFQPNLAGDYEISISVSDAASTTLLGSQSITVRVVPTPAAFGAGLIGMGAVLLRRRTA
ncbi:hypothetical protein [Mucisphaera sp.]|uniref:hypothetical protein n=1 Tax=Mucisphaera sp. TaxID=2913024 RepID=UPI003D0E3136